MDRNGQFEYINKKAGSFLTDGQPVISVDTKKKELVGNFKNAGREWRPKVYCGPVLRHPAELLPAVDLGGRVWLGGKPCKGGPAAPAFGG